MSNKPRKTPIQDRPEGGDDRSNLLASQMRSLISELFPICRSITGDGLRTTLQRIQREIPITVHEVSSGTQVFDWEIPPEWNVRDATIRSSCGQNIVDFQASNLHLVNYSEPVSRRMNLHDLQSHLHSLPEQPDWIPYRTSYYQRTWGFCLPHRQRVQLPDDNYEVQIDTQFDSGGSLSYGELLLPGRLSDEVLFSCHVCHPSLANDNLASLAIAVQLARHLAERPRRYSYRFLFAPGTIGTIAWLALNPEARQRVRHGLVLALLGNDHCLTYKRTRTGNAPIDNIVSYVLKQGEQQHEIVGFDPFGYDERQYGSPGIDLPVGRLSRSVQAGYPEYHTSADNLDLVQDAALVDSLDKLTAIVDCLESDRFFLSKHSNCEPQLGRHGLYQVESGASDPVDLHEALLWNLNSLNGRTGLFEISNRSGLSIDLHNQAAELLLNKGLTTNVRDPLPASCDPKAPDATLDSPLPASERGIGGEGPSQSASHGVPSAESIRLSKLAHATIPGGAHTYAKGDDQFPTCAPRFFVRGQGCYTFDSDGNRFIEYGNGLRSVSLGHAFPAVVEAAHQQMQRGSNFTRPSTIELELAHDLLALLPAAEMVKFTKNGSDATTAAIRLARAKTGRAKVLLCGDQPFFSVDDWFIGTTAMDGGIPKSADDCVIRFPYDDLERLEELFKLHSGQFACLIMEAETYQAPSDGYLKRVQELCRREGTLFVLDEMITGFRWHNGGAQAVYGLQPDLSTFGKALGNGFSVAALVGRREHMALGGLEHDQPRVFLLSYTHGAEAHCLAAARATIRTYNEQPVIEALNRSGKKLRRKLTEIATDLKIQDHFYLLGRDCNLIFVTADNTGERSQAFRSLLLQELIKAGVFAPSLVVSYAHQGSVIDVTVDAFRRALLVYKDALKHGVDKYLVGPASKPVFRKYN